MIRIGDRVIGEGEPVFVIAEIGSNHNGILDSALFLIDAAVDAGADAVKFQLFKADTLYNKGDDYYQLFKDNELPREWIPKLAHHASKNGVVFLASVFDTGAVDLLEEVGVLAYKIASSEATNLNLLEYTARKMKPMILSTGTLNLQEIKTSMDVIYSTGNHAIALLQCTCLYPAKPSQVNLRAMNIMREKFGVSVGLSDHTLSIAVPVAAVGRDACIIEKHFTLSRGFSGPDHPHALEPHEFAMMVNGIREAEASLGSPEKTKLPEEKERGESC